MNGVNDMNYEDIDIAEAEKIHLAKMLFEGN